MRKTTGTLKLFVLLTLSTTISGCSASPEMSESVKNTANQNLQAVKTEKPKSSPGTTKIPNGNTSNFEPATNSNSSINTNNLSKLAEEAATVDNVITHDGFGKIKVGMSVSQASQVFGTDLIALNRKERCHYIEPKQGFKGVSFMVVDNVITRIDIQSKEYATDKGAKIGDTEAKIKSLYKKVQSFPQKYDEKKHNLEVYSEDKKRLIIFETDGRFVTGFRAGRAEEVSWAERCG